MEPDLLIALKLLEVMPQRYLSPNADDLTDGELLADDVASIVEVMWPVKAVAAEQREVLTPTRHQPPETAQYGRPSNRPDAVLAENLKIGDVLEVVEPLSDRVAGELGEVTMILQGAVNVDFGGGCYLHCSNGDYLDRVKLASIEKFPESLPPVLCCGGDSKACEANGPCRFERERRGDPELYLKVGDASKGRDAWFRTPEHQKKEQETQDDTDAGRVKEVLGEGLKSARSGSVPYRIVLIDGPVRLGQISHADLVIDERGAKPTVLKRRDGKVIDVELKDLREGGGKAAVAPALVTKLAELLREIREFTSAGEDSAYRKAIDETLREVTDTGVW